MKSIGTFLLVMAFLVGTFFAGPALAGPDNFGGEGKAWTEQTIGESSYFEHKSTEAHTKNFNSSQGAGKRFSQPGKAEGRANSNSVISDDPVDLSGAHPGTQVLPGSNR